MTVTSFLWSHTGSYPKAEANRQTSPTTNRPGQCEDPVRASPSHKVSPPPEAHAYTVVLAKTRGRSILLPGPALPHPSSTGHLARATSNLAAPAPPPHPPTATYPRPLRGTVHTHPPGALWGINMRAAARAPRTPCPSTPHPPPVDVQRDNPQALLQRASQPERQQQQQPGQARSGQPPYTAMATAASCQSLCAARAGGLCAAGGGECRGARPRVQQQPQLSPANEESPPADEAMTLQDPFFVVKE